MNYLTKRKKLDPDLGHKLAAPHKIERVPLTVNAQGLIEVVRKLQCDTLLDARNRALMWTLAETGCLVSEVAKLRFEQWVQKSPEKFFVHLLGKSSRWVPVSKDLYQAIQDLKEAVQAGAKESEKNSPWIFLGFNKFGSLGSPISPRGIEMLVKLYGPKLGLGELTPRIFRHSVILQWFQQGVPQAEIQLRLGLKTTYAFRSYEPLLKEALNPAPKPHPVSKRIRRNLKTCQDREKINKQAKSRS